MRERERHRERVIRREIEKDTCIDACSHTEREKQVFNIENHFS